MIALKIEDMKAFVNHLLLQPTFDKFYLGESTIRTFSDFKLGGSLNKAYYTSDDLEALEGRELVLWSEVKPFVYNIIKGNKLPLSFHFIFQLSDEHTKWLLERNQTNIHIEDVKGLYINVRYDQGKMTCVTGTSFKTFIMDKTLGSIWDDTVKKFFKQHKIAYTEV